MSDEEAEAEGAEEAEEEETLTTRVGKKRDARKGDERSSC